MNKLCTKCGTYKDAETYFYKDSNKKDGYYSSCKECNKEYLENYSKEHRLENNAKDTFYRKALLSVPWEELSSKYEYNKILGKIFLKSTGEELQSSVSSHYLCVSLSDYHCYYQVHRLAWFLSYKTWPKIIDHINGNKFDNRLENLRECSSRENSTNLPRHRNGGLPGAHFRKDKGKWVSYTRDVNGKRIYLGHTWKTEREASLQYCRYVLKHGLVRREFLPDIFTDEELGI